MPPKKGKKGKNSKGNKAKKSTKIPLTPKEEILQYQINVHEETLLKRKLEWERINTDHLKMNEQLKKYKIDRDRFAEEMIRQYKEFLKKRDESNETVYDKADVTSAMKSNWEVERIEVSDIKYFESEIKENNNEIRKLTDEIKKLEYMRDEEINSNETQIKALKQFQTDMHNNFSFICDYTKKNYKTRILEITQIEETSVEHLHKTASLKASKVVTDDAKHELSDNQWLKNKAAVHENSLEQSKEDTELLQAENIGLHSKISELNQANSTFNSFYMTEIEPDDILFNEGILEYEPQDVFHLDSKESKIQFKNKSSQEPLDPLQTTKDYLNFNTMNLNDLSLAGKHLTIRSQPPMTEVEKMEAQFTLKELPISIKTINNLQ